MAPATPPGPQAFASPDMLARAVAHAADPAIPARLSIEAQEWPIEGEFVIARGARRSAHIVKVRLKPRDKSLGRTPAGLKVRGRGECVPYQRYGETIESVTAQIESLSQRLGQGLTRADLRTLLPAGAARNAIDCAMWDLAAKVNDTSVAAMLGIDPTVWAAPVTTAYTISLGPPDEMAGRARWAEAFPLLKLKLTGEGDAERMAAVRAARPDARISVDANEAWSPERLADLMAAANVAGVELVEQPLPAGADTALAGLTRTPPVCADESMHSADDVGALKDRYDAVNVKLDKTGGLTAAIDAVLAARKQNMRVMLGCMVGTSLAMAPAMVLAPFADWVDLDGPLMLARDRSSALHYDGPLVTMPTPALWG